MNVGAKVRSAAVIIAFVSLLPVASAYAGPTQFVASKDGTRIAYQVNGSGAATVILLHGGGQTRRVWQEAGYVERLAGEFRVISIDLRGNGDSAKPETADAFAIDRVVDDVLAVADATGARTFSLWGFSYGANVGRYVALKSNRVRSMIYIGIPFGPAAGGIFRDTILSLRAKWQPIIAAHRAGTFDETTLSDADRQTWQRGTVPLNLAWLSAMLDYPAVEPADMPCPTLWIVGTANKDTMTSVGTHKDRLSDTRVRLKLLDGLTHPQELERIDQTLPPALEFTRTHP